MPDVLVVQWARLGDLCQTRPLLDSLRREDEKCVICLSYDAKYHHIVERFPEVCTGIPLPLQQIVANCRTDSLLCDAFAMLKETFVHRYFDRVINLTNHPAAVQFSAAVSARLRQGYGFNEDATWSALIESDPGVRDVASRASHVADIWKFGTVQTSDAQLPRPLHTHAPHENARKLAIICDAGDPVRDLDTDVIASLAADVSPLVDEVVLLGSMRPDRSIDHVRDLRGTTSLTTLFATLANCRFVVGPDTGALHLAAAIGCSVFGLYYSGARPERTGPYSLDARCIVCEHRDDLRNSLLSPLIHSWLAGREESYDGSLHISTPDLAAGVLHYSVAQKDLQSSNDDDSLSIVIVEYGQVHYCDELLEDLSKCSPPGKCEILVVSSGLCAADAYHARRREGVKAYVSDAPLTFADANNLAAKRASNHWLLFLNDDCRIAPEVFAALWDARDKRGIVGPKLVYWDGEPQSSGIRIDTGGVHEITEDEEWNSDGSADIEAISAAAMLCERKLFEENSGFDASFVNGYEDVDFCLRARNLEAFPKIIPHRVVHFRSSSSGRFENEDSNMHRLTRRWNHLFEKPSRHRTRNVSSCRLLVLSDVDASEAGPTVRWLSPLRRLGLERGRDFEWLSSDDLCEATARAMLADASAIVVFRSLSNLDLIEEVERWQKQTHGLLLHDCDDLLLSRFPQGTPRAAARKNFEAGVERLIRRADFCSAPHPELHAIHLVEQSRQVILQSIPMPEHFSTAAETDRDNVFRIGYAGGASHMTDFAQIVPALEHFLEYDSRSEFYWWGAHPGPLANHPAVRRGGAWQSDYLRHLARLKRVPINLWLVPLADSVHNRMRSPIKVFEYFGMHKPALCAGCEPYVSVLGDRGKIFATPLSAKGWLDNLHFARSNSSTADYKEAVADVNKLLKCRSSNLNDYRRVLTCLGVTPQVTPLRSELCTA